MTEPEIIELFASQTENIESAFEFWMAASFAVIVGIHAGRGAIPKKLKILALLLYVSLSLAAILQTVGSYMLIGDYYQMLEEPLEGGYASFLAGMIRLGIYIVGTIAISTAIFNYEKWLTEDDNQSK